MYNCFLEFWSVNTNFNNFYWLLGEKLLLSFIPNEQYRILCLKWNRVAIIFPLLQALLVFPPGWGVLCCQDLIWYSSCWTRRTRTTTTCCPSTWWPCGPAGAQPAAAPWSPGPAPRSTLSSRPPLTDPCSRGSRWGCCVSCSKANLGLKKELQNWAGFNNWYNVICDGVSNPNKAVWKQILGHLQLHGFGKYRRGSMFLIRLQWWLWELIMSNARSSEKYSYWR